MRSFSSDEICSDGKQMVGPVIECLNFNLEYAEVLKDNRSYQTYPKKKTINL